MTKLSELAETMRGAQWMTHHIPDVEAADKAIKHVWPLFRALEYAEGFVRATLYRELHEPPYAATADTIKTLNQVRNALHEAQDIARSLTPSPSANKE